jgi:hypothetical protein
MLRLLLVIVAIVCFFIALIFSLGWINGTHQGSWEIAGFLALALSFLVETPVVVGYINRRNTA